MLTNCTLVWQRICELLNHLLTLLYNILYVRTKNSKGSGVTLSTNVHRCTYLSRSRSVTPTTTEIRILKAVFHTSPESCRNICSVSLCFLSGKVNLMTSTQKKMLHYVETRLRGVIIKTLSLSVKRPICKREIKKYIQVNKALR